MPIRLDAYDIIPSDGRLLITKEEIESGDGFVVAGYDPVAVYRVVRTSEHMFTCGGDSMVANPYAEGDIVVMGRMYHDAIRIAGVEYFLADADDVQARLIETKKPE